ncbi:hypothetical protein ACQKOF_11860 [Lysinibacillus sp. NPDC093190]|uniref:hypothetical protein n=1 Tax=Lysinibacillus sp. NPDC093190 TaxID=3390575 RepID=UPI003D086C46
MVPGLASGYSFWEEPIHSAYADMSFPLGSYGLYSTTEDLFIWDQALKSSKILRKELTEKMLTPNLGSYACGWMVSEVMGKKCVHHFGDISGYSSDFLRFVDEQVTIIFLSNISVTPVIHLSREIAKIVFDKNVSSPVPAVPIAFTMKDSIVGQYVIENEDKVLTLSINNEELYLTVPKMYGALYKFKLTPSSHNSTATAFLTEMIYERLIFFYSLSGEIERVHYVDCYEKTYMLYKQ